MKKGGQALFTADRPLFGTCDWAVSRARMAPASKARPRFGGWAKKGIE